MKKIIALVFSLLLLLTTSSFANDAWFTIDKYHVDLEIQKDGSMQVTENIWVNFLISSRGIFRQIPIQDAAWDYIHITNIEVIWDPVASLDIVNNNYDVKIWDPNVYMTWPKQYTIRYKVLNAIKAFSETASWSTTSWNAWATSVRQELYWNVIGTQRPTTIAQSTFTVRLPQENLFDTTSMFVVWWAQWEQNSQWSQIQQLDSTTVQGAINAVLQPWQWATIWLKFPSDYFVARDDYNTMFAEVPSLGFWDTIKRLFASISTTVRVIIMRVIMVLFGKFRTSYRWARTGRHSAWHSNKAITPYYLPPNDIAPAEWFWFWYNDQNPQIFVALLYYRATKGRVDITLSEGKKYFFGGKAKDIFIITEKNENPWDATEIDKKLLHEFFGTPDAMLDSVKLNENSYGKMTRVLSNLEESCDISKQRYVREKWLLSKKYKLTPDGEKLFEEMRWYKAFLEKVERPVIEKELQADPQYLSHILPWAVLFGVETRLLKLCEDLLAEVDRYHSYNNSPLNAARFASMTGSIKSSVIAPRSMSSSGSWFWSSSGFGWGGLWGLGGWFSGGGGWGWWGWRW